jgi:hypothetical protein
VKLAIAIVAAVRSVQVCGVEEFSLGAYLRERSNSINRMLSSGCSQKLSTGISATFGYLANG